MTHRKGQLPSEVLRAFREEMQAQIAARQVETVRCLVMACFTGQREPDGTPWPERKDGSGRPLLLTIGDALEFFSDGESVFVDCPSKPHADYQYWGTRTIPARPWSPPPGMPMPPSWAAEVDRSVKDFVRAVWQQVSRS